MSRSDLDKITPDSDLTQEQRFTIYEHIQRRLAAHRNEASKWDAQEFSASGGKTNDPDYTYIQEINRWADGLAVNVWLACGEPGKERATLDPLTDTSTRDLPSLPSPTKLITVLNTTLILHITASKHYSAHTRAFLSAFSLIPLDEAAIASTLKDPSHAVAQAKTKKHAEDAQSAQARSNKTWRRIGMGGAALAGGVLVGVTGGLAAPLVGAGVSTLLGALGVGGTAAGVLATGLAGSSAVCGALFGAYGAKSSMDMAARHTKDVADFAIVPVRAPKDTLAVRLCVSGWLDNEGDVTAPWTVFDDSMDTFALQWEMEALKKLASALGDLIKSHAIKYVKAEILRRTFLASLFASLSPIALLKLGQIVDNPWGNAKALAVKTGKVLGTLLAARAFGTRPITLSGYSLGSLVILTALDHLASLPPVQTAHIVQDVYLLGTPAPTDTLTWSRVRRVVAGRLVNAYTSAEEDYVLALLSRVSLGAVVQGSFGVAGLQPVEAAGVENIYLEGVEGHVTWRGMVGKCLERCDVKDVRHAEVEKQEKKVGEKIKSEIEQSQRDFSAEDAGGVLEDDNA